MWVRGEFYWSCSKPTPEDEAYWLIGFTHPRNVSKAEKYAIKYLPPKPTRDGYHGEKVGSVTLYVYVPD